MKCKGICFLTIVLIFCSTVNCRRKNKSKKVSRSALFISHFLRGVGIKDKINSLSRKAIQICPNIIKKKLLKSAVRRIKQLKIGMKKLKKLRNKSSRKSRKFYRNLGKVHLVKLLKVLFSQINQCSLVPINVSSNIKKLLELFSLISKNKKCVKKECKQFSFRKLNRIYRYFIANLDFKKRGKGKNKNNMIRNIAKILSSILKKFIKDINEKTTNNPKIDKTVANTNLRENYRNSQKPPKDNSLANSNSNSGSVPFKFHNLI